MCDLIKNHCLTHAIESEVESFTIDFMVKGYHIYKDGCCKHGFMCCTVAMMKEVKRGFSGRHPVAENLQKCTLFEVVVEI